MQRECDRSERLGIDNLTRRLIGVLATIAATLLATPAVAQGIMPSAKSASPSGVLVWMDGDYRSIKLPTYGLGFFETSTTTFQKIGPVQTYNPRVTGEGISGGIGFLLPRGVIPGANARVGLLGSFVEADSSQSAVATSAGNVVQLLNGFLVAPCGDCQLPSRLQTNQRNWRLGLNVTTEFSAGPFVFIPSIEVLGGEARTRQIYAQARVVVGGPTAFYDAATKVEWQDAGARVGLAVSVPITPMIDFGLAGTLATVHRHATLDGNDRLDDGFGIISTSTIRFVAINGGRHSRSPSPNYRTAAVHRSTQGVWRTRT